MPPLPGGSVTGVNGEGQNGLAPLRAPQGSPQTVAWVPWFCNERHALRQRVFNHSGVHSPASQATHLLISQDTREKQPFRESMSVLSGEPPLMMALRGPVQQRSEKQGTGAWRHGCPDMLLPCALSSHPPPPGYPVPAAELPRAVASRPLFLWSCWPSHGPLSAWASMLCNESRR